VVVEVLEHQIQITQEAQAQAAVQVAVAEEELVEQVAMVDLLELLELTVEQAVVVADQVLHQHGKVEAVVEVGLDQEAIVLV
jgi:hypothetical protein